jgi:hypothetical protein
VGPEEGAEIVSVTVLVLTDALRPGVPREVAWDCPDPVAGVRK